MDDVVSRAWMLAFTGLGLLVNAPVLATMAAGPASEAVQHERALVASTDAEFSRALREMGGEAALCPTCPPGENCCTANCILTCCVTVCEEGSLPDCSCGFAADAECRCIPDDPCKSKGRPALGVVDAGGAIYVDDRNFLLGNGLWIYAESNGEPGLQRGGTNPAGQRDPCKESDNPDTLLL